VVAQVVESANRSSAFTAAALFDSFAFSMALSTAGKNFLETTLAGI
jgi:hypothetical protein